jgi:hypothetical protein
MGATVHAPDVQAVGAQAEPSAQSARVMQHEEVGSAEQV